MDVYESLPMHPRIENLASLLRDLNQKNVLTCESLHILQQGGASRTEAAITLHLAFEIDLEEADNYVIDSNTWGQVNVEDVFFETLKYLYYKPDDPDYEVDDNRVRISF